MSERDKIPTDPLDEPIAVSRTGTAKTSASCVVDFAEPEQAGEFLRFLASVIEGRKRVRITVE